MTAPEIYLSIDDATRSGWALTRGEHGREPERIASGTFKASPSESYARAVYRLLRGLPVAPTRAVVEMPVPYYEDGKIRNLKGFLKQAGMFFLWHDAIFEVFKIRAETVAPSKWQAAIFRGMGMGSTKAKSDRFCKQKYNYTPEDDNEADALCIAFWMHTRYGYTPQVDPSDPHAGTMRALAENIRRHGGDPALLELLERRRRK